MASELPRTNHVDYHRILVFSIQDFSLILNIQNQLYLYFVPERKKYCLQIYAFFNWNLQIMSISFWPIKKCKYTSWFKYSNYKSTETSPSFLLSSETLARKLLASPIRNLIQITFFYGMISPVSD